MDKLDIYIDRAEVQRNELLLNKINEINRYLFRKPVCDLDRKINIALMIKFKVDIQNINVIFLTIRENIIHIADRRHKTYRYQKAKCQKVSNNTRTKNNKFCNNVKNKTGSDYCTCH